MRARNPLPRKQAAPPCVVCDPSTPEGIFRGLEQIEWGSKTWKDFFKLLTADMVKKYRSEAGKKALSRLKIRSRLAGEITREIQSRGWGSEYCRERAEVLYQLYVRDIESFYAKRFRDQERIRDLIQEVFVRAIERIKKKGIKDPFRFEPYLWSIAQRVYLEERMKQSRLREVALDPEQEELFYDPRESESERDRRQRLQKKLKDMPGQMGEVARAYYRYGYSCREISKRMDIAVNTVKVYLKRARDYLKASIQYEGPAPLGIIPTQSSMDE